MSHSQYQGIGGNLLGMVYCNRSNSAVFYMQICHFRGKADFPAGLFNKMTDIFYDIYQSVSAQMRLLLVENFLWPSGLYENFQDLPVPAYGIFYQRVQLSVGKSSCPALSELHIGFRI